MIYFITVKCASWHGNNAKWPRRTRDTLRPISRAQAHQKCTLGSKISTLFCLVAMRPILVAMRPTFHHLQIGFAYCDTTATNPILSVAMVSRWCRIATKVIVSGVAMVSQWCRIATNIPDCADHVPNTCPLRIFGSNLAIGCKIKGQDDSIG